jgi:hypothetical protein
VAGTVTERCPPRCDLRGDEPVERHVPERPDGLPQVGAKLPDRRRVSLVLRQVAVDELRQGDFLPVEPAEPHPAQCFIQHGTRLAPGSEAADLAPLAGSISIAVRPATGAELLYLASLDSGHLAVLLHPRRPSGNGTALPRPRAAGTYTTKRKHRCSDARPKRTPLSGPRQGHGAQGTELSRVCGDAGPDLQVWGTCCATAGTGNGRSGPALYRLSQHLCEQAFVTSGSAFPRLRRALDSGNATIALAAAAELEHVGLSEALELVLLLRDGQPVKFERAAIRWHARYCREARGVDLDEAQAVLACLGALRGTRAKQAAHALASLVHRRGLERASEALMRWAG